MKPELVHEINALAQDEQTSVSALLEEAAINLLRERGIEFPDYMRHYRKDVIEVAP
ncbi:ribbon-helix-helix protein, CopG family [Sphingobium yanoikuyae]|uniref:ribbon-helix-helix protein, CopG family n=1 Tax=Sphingobium yanoikuyae TaxID=13690 RepID=UPI001F199207|nr:ribbon-helix-helix protein, CopG family [Sphingobium yanoikuyae]